jgi:hypothetical protein
MRSALLAIGIGLGSWALPGILAAAAVDDVPFSDLYLGFATAPPPKVKERTSTASGVETTYKWREPRRQYGLQAAVTSLNGHGHGWGGWVWGAELVAADYDITPGTYSVDGAPDTPNTSSSKLRCQTLGVSVLGGYEYGINGDNDEVDGISGFLTVLPLVGYGAAWADNEVHTSSGSYTREKGLGSYYEAGIRVGGYLTERNWIYGVTVQGVVGSGKVKMDFPGGYSSELTLRRAGFGFGLVAGYRF